MELAIRRTLGLALLAAALFLALTLGAPPPAQAGCNTLSVDGKTFIFYKEGLSCKKAKGLARQTYRTNKPPEGWRCPDASPGNNRRDGANCQKPGTDQAFGYHAADSAQTAGGFRNCGDIPNRLVGDIRARGVSCKVARKTAARWPGCDECDVGAFVCRFTSTGHESGAIKCRDDDRYVLFKTGA